MKTTFSREEWDEFREDCEMYAWRASELQLACWKAVALVEYRLEDETRNDARDVLQALRTDCASQIDTLQAWEKHLQQCDKDEPSQAGEEAIGLASYAMRKVVAWPQRENRISTKNQKQARPIEYSKDSDTTENSDSIGVWTIRFSCE
jgi:hypothetical protein